MLDFEMERKCAERDWSAVEGKTGDNCLAVDGQTRDKCSAFEGLTGGECLAGGLVAITSRMEKERSSKNEGAESDIKGMEKSKIVNDKIQKKSKN